MSYHAYTVRFGDTLSQIALNWLGSADLYRTILNIDGDPVPDPNQIDVGQFLLIPRLDNYITYDVQSGDTLSALADGFLGKASLQTLILDQGGAPIANPDSITVGQRLRIPVHARISSTLTPRFLANMRYSGTQLTDGRHSFVNHDLGGETTVTRITEIVYGDMNNVGADEAAVVLSTHTNNTTGYFTSVYCIPADFQQAPPPFELNLFPAYLGDRFRRQQFYIANRNVHVWGADRVERLSRHRRFEWYGDAQALGLIEVF